LPQTLIDDLRVQEAGLSVSLWFKMDSAPTGALATLAEFGHMWLQISTQRKLKLCDAEGGDNNDSDKCATSPVIVEPGKWCD